MHLPESFNLLYALSGLGVGFLVGMTGVGGGSLMTPLLILLFRVHPQAAVGTDLLYAAITKVVGTLVHGRSQSVAWPVVGRLAMGSVPATLATIGVLHWAGSPSAQVTHVISVALGVALLITAPACCSAT
ncbi:sulfite exporter TauE/SafE family protein, partial [Komagataeibacter kakiaceti]|uniref:sulfite exporter TauE/SafE family protein n=1 Tax=Komagataeibacter kakiaceti TaxID=943261 RepID=UPI00047052DC